MGWISRLLKWGSRESEEAAPTPVKSLRDMNLAQVTGPKDMTARPEFALQILAEVSLKNGRRPLDTMVEMLKVIPGQHNLAKWTMMTKAGVLQHSLGLFILRLSDMSSEELELTVRMTGVTYLTCIKQSMEEADDELKQINRLLDEMPRKCRPERPGKDGDENGL